MRWHWLPTLPALSLSLSSLSLSLTHFAHSPLCSHMIYYNIFACASHTLFAAAAMFDLISSKLSSVSTENTSVSFPASLSVSVLVRSSCSSLSHSLPLPCSLVVYLCVLFLKGAELTHPTGCPSSGLLAVCLPCQLLLILIVLLLLPALAPLEVFALFSNAFYVQFVSI